MQCLKQGILFITLGLGLSGLQAADWQALPEVAPAPADNPTTPEKVELGRMLYMDPRFSSTGTVSCNSCHNVMLGGEDNRAVSMGVHGKTGGRSAPTVWNSAFSSCTLWISGRASTTTVLGFHCLMYDDSSSKVRRVKASISRSTGWPRSR